MPSQVLINTHGKSHQSLPEPNPAIRLYHQSLPHYKPTPLISLPHIASDLNISHLLLKDETSRLGLPAFKILGASWAVALAILQRLSLSPSDVTSPSGNSISLDLLALRAQEAGLVLFAATDGNHGRAVARMGKYLGIQSRIYVPEELDEEAKSKIESEGAQVLVWPGDYDETVVGTARECEKWHDGKGVMICDTALEYGDQGCQWIVNGYQTMFDEIEEQLLDLQFPLSGEGMRITHVFTPVGVGSLSQAVITHFARTSPLTKIIAVEPESAACLYASLGKGQMTSVKAGFTICSGLCCGSVSHNAWPLLRDGVCACVTVDDEMVDECVSILKKNDVQAGPCGAATLAALREVLNRQKEVVGLNDDSVVLMLCTEGPRSYKLNR